MFPFRSSDSRIKVQPDGILKVSTVFLLLKQVFTCFSSSHNFISSCELRINGYLYSNFWLNYPITWLRKYYYNVTIVTTMFVTYVCLFFLTDSERSYSRQWSARLPHSHLGFTGSQIYLSCHANSPQWPQPPPKCWASQSPTCYWGLSCWRGKFKNMSEQVDNRYSLHASYSVHDIRDMQRCTAEKK